MKMSCRTKKLLENQTIWWWWVWRKPERRRPTESNRKRRSLAGFACERRRARRGQVRSELDSNLNRIWTQVGIEYLNSSLNWIWIWTELNLHYLTTIDALKIKEVESLTSLQLVYGWPWFCFAGGPELERSCGYGFAGAKGWEVGLLDEFPCSNFDEAHHFKN